MFGCTTAKLGNNIVENFQAAVEANGSCPKWSVSLFSVTTHPVECADFSVNSTFQRA